MFGMQAPPQQFLLNTAHIKPTFDVRVVQAKKQTTFFINVAFIYWLACIVYNVFINEQTWLYINSLCIFLQLQGVSSIMQILQFEEVNLVARAPLLNIFL